MSEAIIQYRQLRDKVDQKAAELSKLHQNHLRCRQGCHDCCINLTVWPVEFFSIVEEMKAAGVPKPEFGFAHSCGFLQDGLCQIYPYRPIICRTHGLPLVYIHDETRPDEYAVSFCEKNFMGIDMDTFLFTPENTLHLDEMNEQLAIVNLKYLEEKHETGFKDRHRIELCDVLKYL